MKAFVFPGQGSQFSGMGRDLYEASEQARQLFKQANDILGFDITDIMFNGSADDLKQTRVTQPAVFIHSVISFIVNQQSHPDMTAGHSLGEYSALVAANAIRYQDALKLVEIRANAMQAACELQESTMAAILGLDDELVKQTCSKITEETVVAANFNCPGQIVISGTVAGVEQACQKLKEMGARRALRLPVGGAFHSPLMQPAANELKKGILNTEFHKPLCPIYQNVSAKAETNETIIKNNLIAQLTAPVRWTETVKQMINDGANEFYEFGPGDVLKGLIKKINPEVILL